MKNSFYQHFGKRALDLFGAIFGLAVLSPLFLIIAVLVKATSRGPVFFRQIRVGQFGKPFRIFKFRSMTESRPGQSALLTATGDPRITPVGRWLRKTKLDEFPQLVNVLLGQMSLVGPRPEVPEYVATYSKDQRRVLLAKPGITSPVAARNFGEEELLASQTDTHNFYLNTLLPAKLEIELAYCANMSFLVDMKWILATLLGIFVKTKILHSPLLRVPEKQS